MKKFAVALCGIFIISVAYCKPSSYKEPGGKSDFGSEWKVVGDYSKELQNYDLYSPWLLGQMCYDISADSDCTVRQGDGTRHDEKAVVYSAAEFTARADPGFRVPHAFGPLSPVDLSGIAVNLDVRGVAGDHGIFNFIPHVWNRHCKLDRFDLLIVRYAEQRNGEYQQGR